MKRRDFLKLAGLTSAVVATGGLMNMDKLYLYINSYYLLFFSYLDLLLS